MAQHIIAFYDNVKDKTVTEQVIGTIASEQQKTNFEAWLNDENNTVVTEEYSTITVTETPTKDRKITHIAVPKITFYTDSACTTGKMLQLTFTVGVENDLTTGAIEKIEYSVEDIVPENVIVPPSESDKTFSACAEETAKIFAENLNAYVRSGAKDSKLRLELSAMFTQDAIVEVSVLGSNQIGKRQAPSYLGRLKTSTMTFDFENPIVEGNVATVACKQTFKSGSYCDITHKNIYFITARNQCVIQQITVEPKVSPTRCK
ncbi:hypothetical protein FACS1894201_09030 [Bacteroidia bacterium]|nr:hypothetical protein FACS1894201_09030 [Bacteroidia bacterium]